MSTQAELDARLDVLAAVRAAHEGDDEGFESVLANTDADEALRAAVAFLIGLVGTMTADVRAKVLSELTRAALSE